MCGEFWIAWLFLGPFWLLHFPALLGLGHSETDFSGLKISTPYVVDDDANAKCEPQGMSTNLAPNLHSAFAITPAGSCTKASTVSCCPVVEMLIGGFLSDVRNSEYM